MRAEWVELSDVRRMNKTHQTRLVDESSQENKEHGAQVHAETDRVQANTRNPQPKIQFGCGINTSTTTEKSGWDQSQVLQELDEWLSHKCASELAAGGERECHTVKIQTQMKRQGDKQETEWRGKTTETTRLQGRNSQDLKKIIPFPPTCPITWLFCLYGSRLYRQECSQIVVTYICHRPQLKKDRFWLLFNDFASESIFPISAWSLVLPWPRSCGCCPDFFLPFCR